MSEFKTFIVNLDKDTARMSFMHEQMNTCDIPYERLSAIHGKHHDFADEYIDTTAIKMNGQSLTPGELGCAKSHKLIYERILKESIPYTLVLEDDVELPKNFKQIIIQEILQNTLRPRWEYLSFDYPEPGLFFLKHWLYSILLNYKKQITLRKKVQFTIHSTLKACYIVPLTIWELLRDTYYKKSKKGGPVKFHRSLYLTGAYIITLSGAEKVYSLTNPIVYPADRSPDEARKKLHLKFFAYSPLLTHQKRDDFGSSIQTL